MSEVGYQPLFVPDSNAQPFDVVRAQRHGDRSGSKSTVRYIFDGDTALAVNIALATGRPLLLRGHPGTGKTSLARSVAEQMNWRFYADTVSSRTSARDLQWTFDAVARLADAQPGPTVIRPDEAYVKPGVIWWAFDRDSAAWRGLPVSERGGAGFLPLEDPSDVDSDRSVLLIDEIDKADPDVPNDLLEPLGSLQFRYNETTVVTAKEPPLVVITTNEERDLPRAFLRRCVVHTLKQPDPGRLRDIAIAHAGDDFDDEQYEAILSKYKEVRAERVKRRVPPPSLAELLDALAACRELSIGTQSREWPTLALNLLDKATTIPDEEP